MARRPGRRPLTYAAAGVGRRPVARGLAALLASASYRPPPSSGRRVELAGHYAGLLRIGRETLALTTDTVGTKTLLARDLGRWEEVGEDAVAVNVNDLAAVGARPAAFVDCLSLPRPDPKVLSAIGRGLDRGLRASRAHLLGGETAVVPELVRGPDVGGTALGFFPPGRRPVTGALVRPGDHLVGLASSGLHANGLTLARRIVRAARWPLSRARPGGPGPLGEEMLRPSRIYVAATEAVAALPGVSGLAHISGGGVRNLVRLNPKVGFELTFGPEPPGLFPFLSELGGVSAREMYQTFNMGTGFVIVVRPDALGPVRRRLAGAGYPDAHPLGRVVPEPGVRLPALGLSYHGYS
ncbi:MAG: phosphoribosylformylglycinamidine cyclo-ligase [Thermoplasmata archaeon]